MTKLHARGMVCPKCGSATRVFDSRPILGSVARRRRCLSCAESYTTFEVPLERMERVERVEAAMGVVAPRLSHRRRRKRK